MTPMLEVTPVCGVSASEYAMVVQATNRRLCAAPGIISGATELIPVLGPIVGAIPALLFGLIVDGGTGLVMLAIYVGVQQIENTVLVPRILGGSVDIHPAILIVLLIVMGDIFGLPGVLLAAPLAAIARDVFVYIYRRLEGCAPAVARAMVSERGAPSSATTLPI